MVDIKIYGRYSTDNGATYLSELVWSKEMQYNDQTIYDEVIFEQSLNSAGKLDLSMREYSPFFTNFVEEKYAYLEIFFNNVIFWRGAPYELSISANQEGGKRLIQKVDVSYQGILSSLDNHNVNSTESIEDTGFSSDDNIFNCFRNVQYWNLIFTEYNNSQTKPLEKIFFDDMQILVDNSSDTSLQLIHADISAPLWFKDSVKSVENFGSQQPSESTETWIREQGSHAGYSSADGYMYYQRVEYTHKQTTHRTYEYSASFPSVAPPLVEQFFEGFLSSNNELSILQNISGFRTFFGGNLYQSISNDQLRLKLIEEQFVPIQETGIQTDSVISFQKVKNIDRIYKTLHLYELHSTSQIIPGYESTEKSSSVVLWTDHYQIGYDQNRNPVYVGVGYPTEVYDSNTTVDSTEKRSKTIYHSTQVTNSDVTLDKDKNVYFAFINDTSGYYKFSTEQVQHIAELYAEWDRNHRYTIKIEAFDRGFVEDQPIIDMNKRIPVTMPEIGLDKVPGLVTAVHYEFLAPENNRVSIEIGTKDASYLYSPLTKARIMNAKEDGNG